MSEGERLAILKVYEDTPGRGTVIANVHVEIKKGETPNGPALQETGRVSYQILQAVSLTIGSPFLQPKALANASMFEIGPLARNCGNGCGLVLV